MKETERRKVWVRAGGRCAMCGTYLLDGDIGSTQPVIGEAAHNKGKRRGEPRSDGGRSKSARHEFLVPGEDPDDPDNVVLLCRPHHVQVDAEANSGTIDVEVLRGIKVSHEQRIRRATGFAMSDRTAVIRVLGDLYGETVQCSRLEATGATMRCGQRIPEFALAVDHAAIECDLRGLPGEPEGAAAYFEIACQAIDALVDGKLRDGIVRDQIGHVSVFAFARLPLLVYLGSRLGDAVSSDIYQRSRLTESWEWLDPDREAGFTVKAPPPSTDSDAVVLVNASGSIQHDELPDALQELPVYELRTDESTVADANVIRSAADMKRFQTAFYELIGRLEDGHKGAKLHLVAAVPLSAAVSIGRSINLQVFDTVEVYHRHRGAYEAVVNL